MDSIGSVLFGKTRRAILSLFFSDTDSSFYVRQIVRAVGIGHGTVQRELRLLNRVGILKRLVNGNQVFYQANGECPIFKELKAIITKTAGVSEVIREALMPACEVINAAFIFGSYASSKENRGSDVDVMIIGDISFSRSVELLKGAQKKFGREINPVVMSKEELDDKVRNKHYFIRDVLSKPLIFLIGDKHEFEDVVA
jgi:predicted nucleotidyltransferase